MSHYKKFYVIAGMFLVSFLLWTAAVCFVDVQAIGPQGSSVGLATINGSFHELTGVSFSLYILTDWLSLIPLGLCLSFGILGLVQWIKRKNLFSVDHDILILGVFYLVVMTAFIFFETVVINYRPVLINGVPEASYPSSTTILTLCVTLTAITQLRSRIKNHTLKQWITILFLVFTVFMVIIRLVSGVHWFSDIIGGILLSMGLVTLYNAIIIFLKIVSK